LIFRIEMNPLSYKGWHKEIDTWAKQHPEFKVPSNRTLCRFQDESITKSRTKRLSLKAGDLLIFDSRLVHGSYANATDKWRSFVYLNYFPIDAAKHQTLQSRIDSFNSGEQPNVQSLGATAPPKSDQPNTIQYKPPNLTPLGKKLLGLESWNVDSTK